MADVDAFSIDDVTTTEIDDAFSVVRLDDGTGAGRHPYRRARPGHRARTTRSTRSPAQRMSTVYMPGDKITMLPDELVEAYTLAEGTDLPGAVAVR